jgi:hypothetical protein
MGRNSVLSAILFALLLASAGMVSPSAYAGDDSGELALKPADVALYLQTMRAAADRIRHPTKEDTDLLQRAKADLASTSAGKVDLDPDFDALDRAMYLHGGMTDDLIVEEKHLDLDSYDRVVRAVEDAVPGPNEAYGDGGGLSTPYVPTAEERAQEAILAANRKMLAPDIKEIHELEAVARKTTAD